MRRFSSAFKVLILSIVFACLTGKICESSQDYITENYGIVGYAGFAIFLVIIHLLIVMVLIKKLVHKDAFKSIYEENKTTCLNEYKETKEKLYIPTVGLAIAVNNIISIVHIHRFIIKRYTKGESLEDISKVMEKINVIKNSLFNIDGNDLLININYEDNLKIVDDALDELIIILEKTEFNCDLRKLK